MPDRQTSPPPPGLNLADIYYVVFRHKWKIVAISALGIVGAALLPLFMPRKYQSEAKLLIRYVLEGRTPNQMGASDSRPEFPDSRGENLINTEMEILTSLDLAQEVVTNIGAERILAKAGGGADPQAAATLVRKNLLAEVPKKSNVIRVVFQHPDPAIVQPVLASLVEIYLNRQALVHKGGAFDEFLTQQTDELRSRLTQTEQELRRAKTNAGVLSIDDTKKIFGDEISKIQQSIFDAEAELAERQGAVSEMTRLLHAGAAPSAPAAISQPPGQPTNNSVSGPTASARSAALTNDAPVPAPKLAEYKRLCGLLDSLAKREQDMLVGLTPASPRVKAVQAQIADAEKSKEQLELEYPALLAVKIAENKPANQSTGPHTDLVTEMARVTALEAKIKVLNNQLAQIRKQATVVDEMEGSITELQRKKELEETHYKYFADKLEESRIDEALGRGGVSNIRPIQSPSPPLRDNLKLQKLRAGLLFGAIAAGLALAFFIELYFDRSVKRPAEIEGRLGLPLFISIPLLNGDSKPRFLKVASRIPLLAAKNPDHGAPSPAPSPVANHAPGAENATPPAIPAFEPVAIPQSALPAPHLPLRPFYETLRDRLIGFFESRNLTHKPKLVALTSCGDGAGVTTTSAGLAACLSETGEGNVLLVDMNRQHGEAHHFFKGRLDVGLDEALENGKRDDALVHENLYLVSEATNGDKLPRVLPRRFRHLMPKLRASDYDYIIFDMPPISQISATPRLAGFMDMVFVVVESEKTDRDVLKRATSLLAESKCNLGVILNKAKSYVPKQLQQEL